MQLKDNMLNSNKTIKSQSRKKRPAATSRYKKLASIGEISKGILSDISSPVDATNRFINLALQSIGENPQGRQFLIESKEGIRKMSVLLQKLNQYAKKLEDEIRDISDKDSSR